MCQKSRYRLAEIPCLILLLITVASADRLIHTHVVKSVNYDDFSLLCGDGIPLLMEDHRPRPCQPRPWLPEQKCPTGFWCHEGENDSSYFCCPRSRKFANRCHLPPAVGYGKERMRRFYFDWKTDACHELQYSGIGGNENSFMSYEKCEAMCRGAGEPPISFPANMKTVITQKVPFEKQIKPVMTVEPFIEEPDTSNGDLFEIIMTETTSTSKALPTTTPTTTRSTTTSTTSTTTTTIPITELFDPNPCSLLPDQGIIGGVASRMWYFDGTTLACVQFTFLGLGGNVNMFESASACQKTCGIGKPTRKSCDLPPSIGNGPYRIPRFYFDPSTKQCEQFYYSGSDGNDNRFYKKHKCERLCLRKKKNLKENGTKAPLTTDIPTTQRIVQNLVPVFTMSPATTTEAPKTHELIYTFPYEKTEKIPKPTATEYYTTSFPTLVPETATLPPMLTHPPLVTAQPTEENLIDHVFSNLMSSQKAATLTSNLPKTFPLTSTGKSLETKKSSYEVKEPITVDYFIPHLPPTEHSAFKEKPAVNFVIPPESGSFEFKPDPAPFDYRNIVSHVLPHPNPVNNQITAEFLQLIVEKSLNTSKNWNGEVIISEEPMSATTAAPLTTTSSPYIHPPVHSVNPYAQKNVFSVLETTTRSPVPIIVFPMTTELPVQHNRSIVTASANLSPCKSLIFGDATIMCEGRLDACPRDTFCQVGEGQSVCCPILDEPPCFQPLEEGLGPNQIRRWGFNPATKLCHTFIFRGFKGNQNNFQSYEECRSACGSHNVCPSGSPVLPMINTLSCIADMDCPADHVCFPSTPHNLCCPSRNPVVGINGDQCTQPLSTGYGHGHEHRWAFENDRCVSFLFHGSGGNMNNFLNRADCERTCYKGTPRERCYDGVASGFGNQYLSRYFYSREYHQCVHFIYTGQGGNANNFERLEDCLKSCVESNLSFRSLKPSSSSNPFSFLPHDICPQGEPLTSTDGSVIQCDAAKNAKCPGEYVCTPVGKSAFCCPSPMDYCLQSRPPLNVCPEAGSQPIQQIKFTYDPMMDKCVRFNFDNCHSTVQFNLNAFASRSKCSKLCCNQGYNLVYRRRLLLAMNDDPTPYQDAKKR